MIHWLWILGIVAVIGIFVTLFLLKRKPSKKVCPNNCSGHGTCNTTTGKCSCEGKYIGLDCGELTCEDCGQHGKCDSRSGLCTCETGWTGEKCDTPYIECLPNCNTEGGYCDTNTGKCICKDGYHGVTCSAKECSPKDCSGHGRCNDSGTCVCEPGFIPPDCSKSCVCERGKCDNLGRCICNDPWYGSLCDYCKDTNKARESGCVCPLKVTCAECPGKEIGCVCKDEKECNVCVNPEFSFRSDEHPTCVCKKPYTTGKESKCNQCLDTTKSFESGCKCPINFTNFPHCDKCIEGREILSDCLCPTNYIGDKCEISITPMSVSNFNDLMNTVLGFGYADACPTPILQLDPNKETDITILNSINEAILKKYTKSDGTINWQLYKTEYYDFVAEDFNRALMLFKTYRYTYIPATFVTHPLNTIEHQNFIKKCLCAIADSPLGSKINYNCLISTLTPPSTLIYTNKDTLVMVFYLLCWFSYGSLTPCILKLENCVGDKTKCGNICDENSCLCSCK